MTEKEAWQKWFEKRDRFGNTYGLCEFIDQSPVRRRQMRKRLKLFGPTGKSCDTWDYFWNLPNSRPYPARAIAVGLLMAMAEEEEE